MWKEVNGQVKRFAGASGSVSLPAGAQILSIIAHNTTGGGTVAMPDGAGGTATAVVPEGAWFVYDPKHLNATGPGAFSVVFTGTDSYMLEAMSPMGW